MPGASATRPAGLPLVWKIFGAAVVLVVLALGAALGVASARANRAADASVARALQATRRAVDNQLDARTRVLITAAGATGIVPQFRTRLLSSSHANALDQAQVVQGLAGAAWALVTDGEGILVARTDQPEAQGQDMSAGKLVADALSGDTVVGAWVDDANRKLYRAVAIPLADSPTAAPQGVLITAFAFDSLLAADIKAATNTDIVFFALDSANHPYPVGSTVPAAELAGVLDPATHVDSLVADTAGGMGMAAQMHGEHYLGLAEPLFSAGNDVYGGFVALRSRDAELEGFRAVQQGILLGGGLGLLIALVLAFVGAEQISGPVRRLALATRKVRDGDFSVELPEPPNDEIGMLAADFRALVEDLREKNDLVEYMMSASGGAPTQPISAMPTAVRAAAAASGDVLRVGETFAGRYEIKGILGMGGMGVVYRAYDRELREPVAIKTLKREAMAVDAVALERFRQEVRLARKIAHRNVVRLYDLGETGGAYYLTMEFVEGTSLKQLIATRGRLPVPVTVTIGKQLCRALEVAHEQGVIHRDVKPQNLVVEPNGLLKVMDFGIARVATPDRERGLTEAGVSIGTLGYMSPEQLQGVEVDARTDLYSAGVVLFECLTGSLPFDADTPWTLIAKQLEEPVPDVRKLSAEVPEALAAVITRALAKQRDQRFQTAAEMHDALALIA